MTGRCGNDTMVSAAGHVDGLVPDRLRRHVSPVLVQMGEDVEWVTEVILPPVVQSSTGCLAAPPVGRVSLQQAAAVVEGLVAVVAT